MTRKTSKPEKNNVVFGFLGTDLDAGDGKDRWKRWRPTVALCSDGTFPVARLEIFHEPKLGALASAVARDIRTVSPGTKVRPAVLDLADPWDFEGVFCALHDFCRNYPFETEREDYYVNLTTGTHTAQICLFLLAESRHFPARLLQAAPPRGESRRGSLRVIDLDLSRYDPIASRFRLDGEEAAAVLRSGIRTRNRGFNDTIRRIEKVVCASRDPVLLLGPTGSGKTLIASRIYELKKARHLVGGAFVEVNCATIRGDGAMSALFGHVRGAYTGAASDREGLLAAARGGVLLLDEIGELGTDEQAMLLRAVEEKRFRPVGSDREAASDFQLVAATSRDLRAACRRGLFREDLLARISLWTFRLPPLRERLEDIEPNVLFELDRICGATGRRVTMSREAMEKFLAFAASAQAPWPGNFRDLGAAVTRMATLAPGGRIDVAVVEEEIGRLRAARAAPAAAGGDDLLERALPSGARGLDPFDAVQLSHVLSVCAASRSLSEAGRALFAVSRVRKKNVNDADRLRKYLARFGLTFEGLRQE